VSPHVTGGSTLLQKLQAAASDGLLSIKFNVDGYNLTYGSPGFTLGRCVGTIGPSSAAEPQHFVVGRQLLPNLKFSPLQGVVNAGKMYFMPCVSQDSTVFADFGNALPTDTPGSAMSNIGTLAIGWLDSGNDFNSLVTLDPATYTAANWYEQTGGIQAWTLTSDQLTNIKSNRLALSVAGVTTLMENIDGVFVRADNPVYRINANESAAVTVWGTQYGNPTYAVQISVALDPTQLQGGAPTNDPLTNNITVYPPAQPDILTIPSSLTTGSNGQSFLTVAAGNPNTPRVYIDGQVYGIRPLPQATATALGNPPGILSGNPRTAFGFNPWDFISVLVWDEYVQPATPQWSDVAPILAQYAVLYPVMDQLIDLTSETEVTQQAALLHLAFSLPMSDPNSMPVTRDLSDAKRATLLQYLSAQASISPTVVGVAPHGKPVMKAKPAAAPATTLDASASADAVPSTANSKTIAMRNRVGNK
jgi:hypothetical protein